MTEEQAFLHALADNDEAGRLAFADWLAERDDPREAWVRDPVLCRLLRPHLTSPLTALLDAIRALKSVGPADEDALPALARGLHGGYDDSLDAELAVDVLGGLGPAALDAVPALLQQLHYPETRAGDALVKIGPAAAPIILRE